VLSNGITVLARANFNSPSVVVSGYLEAGSLFDPPEKLGLADFTAAALMRGTERRNFQQIYDTLESVGASLGISGGTHSASFGGKALAEDLDLLLGVLSECLRQPVFPPEQVERLRRQLLTGLAIRAQSTEEMASLAFDQLVYQDHPYRHPEDGYPETIQAIQLADLIEFHRQHYGPRGLVLTVVGGVEPAAAVAAVARALGDWQHPSQPPLPPLPPLRPLQGLKRRKVQIPGKSQADLILGAAGPAHRDPAYMAALVGNNILGQFGLMGRIGEAVREKAGLAYYAYSSLSGGVGPGPWYIAAGVDPANCAPALKLIRAELARFARQPISAEELADSQASFIGKLPLALESNGGVAYALLNLERFDLGLDYYCRYPDLVRAVTPEVILAAAQHYLDPKRLAIAQAGTWA
jgi:zinc protease